MLASKKSLAPRHSTRNPQRSTKVPLFSVIHIVESPTAGKNNVRRTPVLETRRRSCDSHSEKNSPIRDVLYQDAELNGIKHKCINAILKHLLAGHQGQPCPAGDRPIVSPSKTIASSPVKRRIASGTVPDETRPACIDLVGQAPKMTKPCRSLIPLPDKQSLIIVFRKNWAAGEWAWFTAPRTPGSTAASP